MNIIPDDRITRAAILTLQNAVNQNLNSGHTQLLDKHGKVIGFRLRDDKNNVMYVVMYNKKYKLNRLNGPAFIHHSDKSIFFILNKSYTPIEYQNNFVVKLLATVKIKNDDNPIVCSGQYKSADGGNIHLEFTERFINVHCYDTSYNHNSINGMPAVVDYSGQHVFEWYKNGKLHNDNGPAIIRKDDVVEWWINGKKHSEKSGNPRC